MGKGEASLTWHIRKPTKEEIEERKERQKNIEDAMFIALAKATGVVLEIECDKNDSVYGKVAKFQVGHFKITIAMGKGADDGLYYS